jgi:hypothetical protein
MLKIIFNHIYLDDEPGGIVDAVTSRGYLSHPLRPKTRFTQGVGPTPGNQ